MKTIATLLSLALAAPLVHGLTLSNLTHVPANGHSLHKRYEDWMPMVCPTGLSDCMTNYDTLYPTQNYTYTQQTSDYTSCTDRPTCCTGDDTSCQFSPAAIGAKVYNVSFADTTSVTVCVCPNNAMTIDAVASRIGQVPKEIRAYVLTYKVANKDNADALKGNFAYADGQRLTFFGDSGLSVVMHEIFHTFDGHFHISVPNVWGPAVFADTCITDYYAKSNRVEHVAQIGVLYTYLAGKASNWNSAARGGGCQDNTLKLMSTYLKTISPQGNFTGIRAPIPPPPGPPAPATVTVGGYAYNLTSLAANSPLVFTGGLGTYYFSLASYLPTTIPCADTFAGACLQESGGALTVLGYPGSYTYSLYDSTAPSSGVKLTYTGGDSCGDWGNRTAVVSFRCGTGANVFNYLREDPTCCGAEWVWEGVDDDDDKCWGNYFAGCDEDYDYDDCPHWDVRGE
ncbi:hypothetical protein HDV00_004582, partial [Rhizophlyctis rosea]